MGAVELTYQDVAEHNTKKDLYVVIADKIYDCTKFVDEHPYVFSSVPFAFPGAYYPDCRCSSGLARV
jgi:hypothetical protein